MRLFPTKRFWKRLALGAAILIALALIANGFMAWLTDHRLQTRIAAIRAAGDPASIADLAPKPIPDDQNAAFYLERLQPRLEEFAREYSRFYKSPLGKAYEDAEDRDESPTAEQIAAIRTIVDKYPDIDRDLAAAAACGDYASRLDYSLGSTPFVESILKLHETARTATRFLRWQMQVSVAEENPSDALDRGIQLLRLAHLYEHEPTIVSFLITVAISAIASEELYDALSAGTISADKHAALDQELVRHDDPQRLVHALKTERAFGISLSPWEPPWELTKAPRFIKWLYGMFGWPMKSYGIGVLDWYEVQIPLAGRPWFEGRKHISYAGVLPTREKFGALADLMVPALMAAYQSNARNLVVLRSLRIFNALLQYAEQNGHEARGLVDLPLPRKATIDPFSGEPLKLKHTDDGWIVYSVMDNGVDDGGDFIDLKDWGVAPPRYRATEKHE